MTRPAALAGALALLAGCGQAPVAREEGPHGYLVLHADDVAKGWATVDALDAALPAPERARIRTAAPVGTGPDLFVDLSGTCATNAALLAHVRRVAATKGVTRVDCSPRPPA